jgi:hypothetical protein
MPKKVSCKHFLEVKEKIVCWLMSDDGCTLLTKNMYSLTVLAQAVLNISADVNNHSPTMIRSNLRVKCCVCSVEHMMQSLVKKSEGGPKQLEEMMGMELKHIKSAAYVKK